MWYYVDATLQRRTRQLSKNQLLVGLDQIVLQKHAKWPTSLYAREDTKRPRFTCFPLSHTHTPIIIYFTSFVGPFLTCKPHLPPFLFNYLFLYYYYCYNFINPSIICPSKCNVPTCDNNIRDTLDFLLSIKLWAKHLFYFVLNFYRQNEFPEISSF